MDSSSTMKTCGTNLFHGCRPPHRRTPRSGHSYAGAVFDVPAAARTACWLNAWIGGREPADEVIGGLHGHATEVEFRGLGSPASLSAALVLGEVRRLGVTHATAALPAPGDLVGLGGPAAFNEAVLDRGEGVVLHGPGLGLVPHASQAVLSWHAQPASPPGFVPDIATADRELRDAFRTTTERLVELDVTSWSPDIADALMNLRTPIRLDAAMAFASPQAARSTITALRALHIVDLALRDDGGSVTASEMTARRDALALLSHAGRQAVVAACSSVDGR